MCVFEKKNYLFLLLLLFFFGGLLLIEKKRSDGITLSVSTSVDIVLL